MKDHKLFWEQLHRDTSRAELRERGVVAGKRVLGMEFVRESVGERHESHGTTRLYIDDKQVAEGPMRTSPATYALR